MAQGFNFKNNRSNIEKNTNDFSNLIVMTEQLPLFASDRFRSDFVINRDGAFTVVDGKSNKTMVTTVKLISKSNIEKMQIVRELAQWLNGPGEMYMNFDPNIRYDAQLLSTIPVDKAFELYEFTLAFDLKPIGELNSDELNPIVASSLLVANPTLVGGYTTSITVTGADTITLPNDGTYKAYPVIKLDGSATGVSIEYNGKTITYAGLASEVVYIDTENYVVYDDSNNNKIANLSGDFFDNFLVVGDNVVNITGNGLNLDITFDYLFKYL